MRTFVSLFICVVITYGLTVGSDDARQFPLLVHRIRNRLTLRPMHHYHNEHLNHQYYYYHQPNHLHILHNIHTIQTYSQTSEDSPSSASWTSSSSSTPTTKESSNSNQQTTKDISYNSDTTISPLKQSVSITPPFSYATSDVSTVTTSPNQKITSVLYTDLTKTEQTYQVTSSLLTSQIALESSTFSRVTTEATKNIKTTTITATKDPCSERKALFANEIQLVRLCYINESLTWPAARQRCLSINYRLFEVNTYLKELSMFNYIKSFAVNQEFHWINGIAEDSPTSADWFVVDPHILWNYTALTSSWHIIHAPIPTMCLGVIFISNSAKFTGKSCDSFKSSFWCEY